MRMLERGGNAADAVLAAAGMLCITEPMEMGVGGDAFALIWKDGQLDGLAAAGAAPVSASPLSPVQERGPRSVTVPGAVGGWSALAERYGRLGLDVCLADAIDAAERGVAISVRSELVWRISEPYPKEFGPPPPVGTRYQLPELATTLRRIAEGGPDVIYQGQIASAIASVCWLEEEDLARYRPEWVTPLTIPYRDVVLAELPPPTQGIAALEGLGLLEGCTPTLQSQVECVRLALEDAREAVRDGNDVTRLIDPDYLARRRGDRSSAMAHLDGGTAYTCAVDGDGMAVSFIGSLYGGFGSGVVAPGTGIVLHNRGWCFSLHGAVEPGRRPYHTIIPGMLLRDDQLLGPFGIVGGFQQAQAHVQFVSALTDDGLDPQAAVDRARFRVEGDTVRLEQGLWDLEGDIKALRLTPIRDPDYRALVFGGGQAILRKGDVLLGASDSRMDGFAAGG
jgi:gamma-glutamyltranspeptidase / glutathione hydrolase